MKDYEKKYKKALECATKAKNNASLSNGTLKVLEIIFPELKESEDERIRKFLISTYTGLPDDATFGGYLCKDILAWLEKQGEKKSKWTDEDDNVLYTIIADFKAFKHDNTSSLEPHFNDCITWLKSLKQRMEDEE